MGNRRIQTASHWGVYEVDVSDSQEIVGVSPYADDPSPSGMIDALPGMVRSPLRIDRPYVRAGYLRHREASRAARGAEPFVPVSWGTALDLIEEGLRKTKAEFGNEAIYGGSYGWASAGRLHHSPSVLKRFLGQYGGYVDKRGNHSFGAALGIAPYVIGHARITQLVVPWPSIVEHAGCVVMFGGCNAKNMQIEAGGAVLHENPLWMERASRAPLRFFNVGPSKADVPDVLGAEWIPMRPNTDVAMMLGLAHTLRVEGLHDRAFLDSHCEGFPAFERYLLGSDDGVAKDAGWASAITGVPADTIRSLARTMAGERTMIASTWSVQRSDHGEQAVWMTIALAAMLGQIGLPGGGFSLGFGAVNGNTVPRLAGIPRPTFPLGENPVKRFVPVGKVADMLLRPGEEYDYDGKRLAFPDIKLIYSVGGNPFHHNSNLNRFLQGWQRPDLVVVHEPWWSPPARYADIVLPATTTLERNDILSGDSQRHYVAMRQVIAPVGQARNDMDIFAELADRLGFRETYTEGRDEMQWLRHMYEEARAAATQRGHALPGFDAFWEQGSYEFPLDGSSELPFARFRTDPATNRLQTPSGKIELFSSRIAGYGYDDCPPHPAWLEPAEWLGSRLAGRYPLHLLSNQPASKLHSQLDAGEVSRRAKRGGREVLTMHPADAAERGIEAGDVVKVFNERGAFLATAALSDSLLRGVLQIATGAWLDLSEPGTPFSLEKHGNPNVVTLDKGTSRLAQGSVAQTVLVDVAKSDVAPPVTAFEPPTFVQG